MNAISVIVPTLNEADNIAMLIERIAAGFAISRTTYEILFVDDNSIDGTRDVINSFAEKYPVRVMLKKGPRGKAHSLLEGFDAAQYDILCMIDADLQYPPEAIVPMHQLMISSDTDIVLTNRQENGTSALRKVTSAGFNFVFTKMMFGFDYDSQSGLKLFKREVINNISLDPTPWSFDMEFIVRSLEKNYKIVSYDITFAQRYAGEAKIQVGKVAYELAKASVKLRLNSSPSKVKSAYKTSNRIAKKTIMASLAFLTLLGVSITATTPSVSALELNTSTVINLLPLTNDEAIQPAPSTPATVAPTVTQPLSPTPTEAPKQAAPVPQSANKQTAPTSRTAPSSIAAEPKAAAINQANPVKPEASTGGAAELAVAPGNNSSLATYPDGTKKTGGFSYTENGTTASAGLIKPLSVVALTLAIASIAAYVFLTQAKHYKFYGNSQAIKG